MPVCRYRIQGSDAVAGSLTSFMRRSSVLFLRRLANRNMTIYAQLDQLERCGIVPNPGVGVADLLARHTERQYETDPFRLLLRVLGEESNDLEQMPLCDNLWHLRVGCITGPTDYAHMARRMATLAGDDLPITKIRDEFDWASGVAWLIFNVRGQEIAWPARVRESWIDPAVFSRFAALLEAQDAERRFTYLDLGGQDALISCATPAQFAEIRRRTGLRFEWLG